MFQPSGTAFYLQGQPAHGVYLICRGTAKLQQTMDGVSFISRMIHAGEILGTREVLTRSTYRHTAEALDGCDVRYMSAADFAEVVHAHPDFCERTLRQMNEECDSVERLRSIAMEDNTTVRVARFLLALCDQRGKETGAGSRVKLSVSHRELAQIIGVSRETVTRKFTELRRNGLLVTRGGSITIPDRLRLEAFCRENRRT